NKLYEEIESILAKVPGYGHFLAKKGHVVKESIKNLVSPAPFFEQYGLNYIGPIDGHDIRKLSETFEALKGSNKPTVVHVLTTKGKGLDIAIKNPTSYHGAKPFDRDTGVFHPSSKQTFPKIFGKHLLEMADSDPTILAITPAMPAGSCLDKFMEKYPKRCIDVGIAEGHSVTYAGGIAFGKKMKVVACLYSSFLQRAFDNVFHDVCLQKLPVLLTIDRAGISCGDGVNMNGIYDIGFLSSMPNMVITQPRNGQVLKELLSSAFSWNSPACIRYPNLPTTTSDEPLLTRKLGSAEVIHTGEEIILIALGHMCDIAIDVKDKLQKEGFNPTIIDPVFIKPLDKKLFIEMIESHQTIITIEEHSLQSGLGSIINSFILQNGFMNKQVVNFGISDVYVEHGKHTILLKELGLDSHSITKKILSQFSLKSAAL
ncbi:MAG: 1-deoxy-D-xylulose-5-phosphate synthase, partial [Simkaniaceae bacterium]|nr:1-deoxy-D-xylulose-5-phosphate synthase [Simkaniaceae bacterium]